MTWQAGTLAPGRSLKTRGRSVSRLPAKRLHPLADEYCTRAVKDTTPRRSNDRNPRRSSLTARVHNGTRPPRGWSQERNIQGDGAKNGTYKGRQKSFVLAGSCCFPLSPLRGSFCNSINSGGLRPRLTSCRPFRPEESVSLSQNTNPKRRSAEFSSAVWVIGVFEFWVCFEFRAWDFVLRQLTIMCKQIDSPFYDPAGRGRSPFPLRPRSASVKVNGRTSSRISPRPTGSMHRIYHGQGRKKKGDSPTGGSRRNM